MKPSQRPTRKTTFTNRTSKFNPIIGKENGEDSAQVSLPVDHQNTPYNWSFTPFCYKFSRRVVKIDTYYLCICSWRK